MEVLLVDQIAKVAYKYTYSLANALHAQGVHVDLAIDQKTESENCICRRNNFFNTDEKNIGKIQKFKNYIFSLRKIRRMLNRRYDILHTQWVIFSPIDYIFFKRIKKNGKHVVITIHDILPFNKKFYDYHFHKKIYKLADAIILQTEENIERFHVLFPDIRTPIYMVPHGHFMDYARVIEKKEARKTLKMPENKFIFLFFGQIKKVKGVDILLKAYADFLKTNTDRDTMLVVAGQTWKENEGKYRDIVKKTQIENCVRMDIRYIPDAEVDLYYSAADVCVLPYLQVYQSGVLQLTYAHHRVPIVTNIGAFTDIVNSDIGFICQVNDVKSLSNAMQSAYNRRCDLETMATQGYQYIKKRFDWDKIAEQVKHIYTEVKKGNEED